LSIQGKIQLRTPKKKTPVSIRAPSANDATAFLDAVRRSRSLHRGWVAPPATPQAYRRYLQRLSTETHRGFLVVHKATSRFVGVININNIIRGAFHSAFLGYYGFADFAGQGLMKEGMRLVLRHAFTRLRLHRLEANIQPENHASLALIRSCGFAREGYSRRYLRVAGRWRDHERWAILAEDWSRLPAAKTVKTQRRLT
jgi:[ribosomal protein S5]-alanine N-acetyltransferase